MVRFPYLSYNGESSPRYRVSENYICFNSPMMDQKLVIPFRTITSINKETSTFGVLANSIALTTRDGEEVGSLIHQVWLV